MLSSPPPPSSTHCPMALVPTESARRPGQQGRPRGWLPGQRSRVCFQMCCLVTHLGSETLPELTLPGHTQKRAVGRVSEGGFQDRRVPEHLDCRWPHHTDLGTARA